MTELDNLKILVATAKQEAESVTKGTCINPRRFLLWRKAEHKWTPWRLYRTVERLEKSGDQLPVSRHEVFIRKCIYCNEPQAKRIQV